MTRNEWTREERRHRTAPLVTDLARAYGEAIQFHPQACKPILSAIDVIVSLAAEGAYGPHPEEDG